MPFPSIQAFYEKEIPTSSDQQQPTTTQTAAVNTQQTLPWRSAREYTETPIADLQTGPGAVKFTGFIVNFSSSVDSARLPFLSPAYHFLLVMDETGAIAVQLQSSGNQDPRMYIGAKVTVWTAHISDYNAAVFIPFVTLKTTIYLGETAASYIEFHDPVTSTYGDIRAVATPDVQVNTLPPTSPGDASTSSTDDMTLKTFLAGGHESDRCGRVVVCVKSIGPRKRVTPRGRPAATDLVEVKIFDETEDDCILALWGDKIASARHWAPNRTVLRLTNPNLGKPVPGKERRRGGAHPTKGIGIGFCSMVEVDPPCSDAVWLRRMAANITTRESVYIPFPSGEWDTNDAPRMLFTIADVDERVRREPNVPFTGKLNVLILGMGLIDQFVLNRLCCLECCGNPVFSNNLEAICQSCDGRLELTLNPRIVGTLADETGCISSGKLVWSDEAWTRLLFPQTDPADGSEDEFDAGPSWEDVTVLDKDSLRSVQDGLVYARLTLTFGWSETVGRLCVLGVEW